MEIIFRITAQEQNAIADVLSQILEDEIGISRKVSTLKLNSGTRSGAGDAVTLTCTILQGSAAAVVLADYVGVRKMVEKLLARIRPLSSDGDEVDVTVDASQPVSLLNSKADTAARGLTDGIQNSSRSPTN